MGKLKRICLLLLILMVLACLLGCVDYSSDTLPTESSDSDSSSSDATDGTEGEHIHSYMGQIIWPTCTEGGYMVHTCNCGHSFVDSPTDALGHSWSQWETVTAPTETEEGMQKRVCGVCDAEDYLVIEPLGQSHSHNFQPTVVEPECTEEGYTVFRCLCGEEYTDGVTEPLGHSWSDWQYTESGQTRSCTRCGATDTVQSAHTHSYSTETVAATCTDGGYVHYYCSCGESYVETVSDPLGHSWGQWQVTQEPTTASEGIKERICQMCGETETESLDSLPVEDGFIIVSFAETVNQGEKATVTIKGRPGVEYTITVYYKSGPATASGLEPAVADVDGYVTWTWKVGGRTTPGTYEIVISGDGITQSIYFAICAKE